MIAFRLPSHFPARASEWMLASIKFGWGVVFLLPFSQSANPYLAPLWQLATQHTWGLIATIAGIIHLSSLWINGAYRRSPHARALCSGVGALFWFQIMLGIWSSGLVTPGWVQFPVFFGFSVYNVVRAMSDAAASDALAGERRGGSR